MSISNEEATAQKFFKGILAETIVKAKEPIALNLLSYDIKEDVLEKISELNTLSTKLGSLSVRLSNVLSDSKAVAKFLQKVIKKKHVTSLGFYLKYLNQDIFDIFADCISRIGAHVTSLKIQVKAKEKEIERKQIAKVLSSLVSIGDKFAVNVLDLRDNRFDNEELISLLSKLISMKEYETVSFAKRKILNNNFDIDLSKVKTANIVNCNISKLRNLPKDKIDLRANNLSKQGLEVISRHLSSPQSTIRKMNLCDNYIGDDGCEIIANGFKSNASLITIDLSSNNILDRGVTAIANALLTNTTIKKINFKQNYIGNYGIKSFCEILKDTAKDKFSKLDFNSNPLSDIGLIEYAKFLGEHIDNKYLAISGQLSGGGENDFFRVLKRMNNLKVIDFYSMDLNSDTMDFLNEIMQNNKNIKEFTLSNNKKIGANGMRLLSTGLSRNTNLTFIKLNQCAIGDEGAEILANALFMNLSISELSLEYNNIGLNGIKALSEKVLRKRCLKRVMLGHNNINHLGAFYIGKYLADAFGIIKLHLNSNHIGDEGCEYISEGIKKNDTLEDLNIENNDITNRGARLIAASIKNKYNFMSLNLSSNQLTEIDDELYEIYDYLSYINIAANKISNSGIIRLFHGTEDNKLFKKIRLCDLDKVDDIFIFKTRNENLKRFDLSYNNINISLIKNILCLKNISYLNLQTNNIDDNAISKICRFIVEYNSVVKSLLLQNNLFTSNGAAHIAEMLKVNKTIVEMNLADNQIKHSGLNKICDVLSENNNTLQMLMVNFTGANDYCANNVAKMLKKNKKLICFSIMGNNFSDNGIDIIISALKSNTTLKQLALGQNKTSEKAFRNLSKYLMFNKTLSILEIKTSGLSDKFLNDISNVFLDNRSLINFNLVNNDIGYDSMCKLSLCLYKNDDINEIKLLLNQPNPEERTKLISSSSHIIFN